MCKQHDSLSNYILIELMIYPTVLHSLKTVVFCRETVMVYSFSQDFFMFTATNYSAYLYHLANRKTLWPAGFIQNMCAFYFLSLSAIRMYTFFFIHYVGLCIETILFIHSYTRIFGYKCLEISSYVTRHERPQFILKEKTLPIG